MNKENVLYRDRKDSKEGVHPTIPDSLVCFVQLLRPRQWSKNIFVFSGLLFYNGAFSLSAVMKSIFAFVMFCGISSCVYIINDIVDAKRDMLHPVKRNRPIPKGKISVKNAVILVFILSTSVILPSFGFNSKLGAIIIAYFILNLLYSFKLKELFLVDLIIISTGFVLRYISGVAVLNANIYVWFLLSVAFLTFFLGLNKRKKEMLSMQDCPHKHRKALGEYSIEFIDAAIPMIMACTVVSYILHIWHEMSAQYMLITVPVVMYGILRYEQLTVKKNYGESPELVLLKDKGIIFTVLLWGLIYFLYSIALKV
ncbi:4-hydroxybenzoate polyprenyltransferase [Anaerobacterium chartisolvens]|uniref:4-hydroxybenzoate polyprenyltransferase n=1 Tax=Anaerobacterium chartisolvens TaxID=1297424 RepID=A0A369BET3_9FIRM|nr:decaprenyl-phosphate phosphoribosyltransferase [Anaerobacterium chartisolvens]RCX20050.1 4-hydroxybenzoate polyprenyltransferase [Anaerobacterium chartisolvens]